VLNNQGKKFSGKMDETTGDNSLDYIPYVHDLSKAFVVGIAG
jgi:hypothetical protein